MAAGLYLLFAFGLVFSPGVYGAASITPLFDDDSMVVGTLIPFKVSSMDGAAISVVNVEGAGPDECRVMVDPYIRDVFHLKCVSVKSDLFVRATLVSGHELIGVSYGPVAVKKISDSLVVIPPKPDQLDTVKYTIGRGMFVSYCTGCHHSSALSPTDIRSVTKNYVENTIIKGNKLNMGEEMGAKPALLSGELDLNKLIYYINNARD
ncbi:MAG: hypothetical protein AB7G93_09700 [Bdellovibrionales bacterium]